MARYHYTRENENGVVLYLESEPAEDAMDEWSPFDDVEEGRAASKRLELERSGFAPDRNYDGQAL